ncbi:uncharacterized protein TNCV_368381 [Trichonephila clavipes]|nr:uncharacterized protein TNCV_368381 [Trichonephila clavipes]
MRLRYAECFMVPQGLGCFCTELQLGTRQINAFSFRLFLIDEWFVKDGGQDCFLARITMICIQEAMTSNKRADWTPRKRCVAVTPKCLGGPSVDCDRLNAHPGCRALVHVKSVESSNVLSHWWAWKIIQHILKKNMQTRKPPNGGIERHNDESVREGYIRNSGKEVKLFTSALKAFQCNICIVMAQRKHLDHFLRGRIIICGRTQLEVSEELESPKVSSPGFGNDSKMMVM